MPATAAPLFFGNLSDDGERVFLAMLADGGEQGVQEGNWGCVRRAEGVRFDAGKKSLVANTGQRGEVSIRNGDAVGSPRASVLRALDRLAQAAAEGDGYDEVLPGEGAGQMNDAAAGSCRERVQTEENEMVFEIVGEGGGQVASNDDDAASFVETLSKGGDAFCI